jgi:hypothetical protein
MVLAGDPVNLTVARWKRKTQDLFVNPFACLASLLTVILFIVMQFDSANARPQVIEQRGAGAPAVPALGNGPVDTPVFIHRRLMHVPVSKSEPVELRYIECRHYSKQHEKIIRAGLTADGHGLLRMVPGDYCEFEHVPSVQVAEPTNPESLKPLDPRRPADGSGSLTEFQQYTCEKFGTACQVALAVQKAENSKGACEIYHYNSADGTLDWGYFQINSVHLTRPGLNLRDLLDCRKNIDFAYMLYCEKGFQPWTTYVSGAYRRYLPGNSSHPLLRADAGKIAPLHQLIPVY